MKKVLIILGSILCLTLIGLGIFKVIGSNKNDSNILTCTSSKYDDTYSADCITEFIMTFDNNELTKFESNTKYQYSDEEAFNNQWGNMTEMSGSGDINGMYMNWFIDKEVYSYNIYMNSTIDELKDNEWKDISNIEDYSYKSMLEYAEKQGLDCK